MSQTKPEYIVACKCGWIGPVSALLNAEGCHHCPKCGEFFMPVPNRVSP